MTAKDTTADARAILRAMIREELLSFREELEAFRAKQLTEARQQVARKDPK